jgi:hypothetical protein
MAARAIALASATSFGDEVRGAGIGELVQARVDDRFSAGWADDVAGNNYSASATKLGHR